MPACARGLSRYAIRSDPFRCRQRFSPSQRLSARRAGVRAAGAAARPSPPRRGASAPPPTPPASQRLQRPRPRRPSPNRRPRQNPAPPAPEADKPLRAGRAVGEASTGESVDLPARPFAYVEGKADQGRDLRRHSQFAALVKLDLDKANLSRRPAGRWPFSSNPTTPVSNITRDIRLAAAPEGKTSLSDAVKIGETPSGKAMRFEHQGAYCDIDATYDAITAYLDDKGSTHRILSSRNMRTM